MGEMNDLCVALLELDGALRRAGYDGLTTDGVIDMRKVEAWFFKERGRVFVRLPEGHWQFVKVAEVKQKLKLDGSQLEGAPARGTRQRNIAEA